MRRAEELQDWIAQVTEQPVEDEHLSVVLQDGQLLCLLANAVDPHANLKVNKLTTVFHSKANVRVFLDWCRRQGLRDQDLFEPDDLLDGSDFVAVVQTLSIIYDKYSSVRASNVSFDSRLSHPENPLSDSDSHTSSGSSSSNAATPTKKKNKLTSFMKTNFLGRKKAAANKAAANANNTAALSPRSPDGTPPNTPPPMSPQVAMSPNVPSSPLTPRRSRSDNDTATSTTSTGSSNASRLNAFLSQVPASHEQPLEHVQRPPGPPRRAPSFASSSQARKENTPMNMNQNQTHSVPPQPPKPKTAAPAPAPPVTQQVGKDARNKFAAFMRANPPSLVTEDADLVSDSPYSPQQSPHSSPPRVVLPKDNSFAQRKAVFSPKAASTTSYKPKTPRSPTFENPGSSNGTSPRRPSNGENSKLRDFMAKQPASGSGANKTRSDSSNSKLAAFLASTGTVSSTSGNSTASTSRSPTSSLSSFTAQTRNRAPSSHNQRAMANGVSSTTAPQQQAMGYGTTPAKTSTPSSRFPFTPRQTVERSSGRCNFVRKRQTYRTTARRSKGRFSLEDKRKVFMNEQLLIKEEQLRLQEIGAASAKQNLIVPGVQCYVPDKEDVWMLSEVVDYNDRTKEVTIQAFLDDGESERRVVDLKDPDTIRAVAGPNATEIESLPIAIDLHDTPGGVEDMRLLRYLNEPSILFNLKQRFEASKPYTYTNDIVIAVNPYKWIDGLYGDHLHDQYLRKPRDSLSPHVYSTSTAAYKHMTQNDLNQSILVSGESGAGKTETTKIVMNHLATVAGGRMDKTIAKVIDVNPLLESFGNAKTTRNDNSSRFGKFTQLQFNDRGKLIGAKCETYLLEKSRVVSIAEGERNYHIFYQMLAGLSSRELADLELNAQCKYQYTGSLNEMRIPGMDDAKWLESTKKSLALIGLDAREQKTLFQILAGVLLLGEIEFEESGESGSSISSTRELGQVARLFGLPSEGIQDALCNRTVITRNDSVTVPLDPVEAVENRDALAKTVYAKMFDWMVLKINDAISSDENDIHGQIGVLDIFGFEDFVQNGFEQFCINYANEKLQQKFTTDVFKTVEDEYIREGLEWDHIQYQDNKDIVEVIDGKMGIIALMNDHLRQPRGTEEALVNKVKTNHHRKGADVNPHIDFPKVKRTQFIINHYAGSVTYETVGFMEKHRDTLQKDLLDLIQSSRVGMLVDLFDDLECLSDSGGARSKNGMGVKSLGSQFKHSLTQLMENIACTNTHYVRCIKPNSNKSATEFNKRMVVEQLRSAGVIEAIRITRSGYPSRLTPQELASRYCIMFPPSMHSKDVRRTCSVFMSAIGRKAPLEYQMGKSLIYFKNGVMEELEAMKSDFMYIEATCIQKIVLGFIYRRRLARMVRAAIVLQSYARMSIDRKEFQFQRRAIVQIQRAWVRYKSVPVYVESEYESSISELDDSFASGGINNQRRSSGSDGGQWVDEMDEIDEEYQSTDSNPARPASRSVMDRIRAFKTNVGRTESDASDFSRDRANSLKRIGDLSSRAKSVMRSSGGSSITGISGVSMEEENAMLRIENRNLKYDLELMREQCIELQAIILEINKSRKRIGFLMSVCCLMLDVAAETAVELSEPYGGATEGEKLRTKSFEWIKQRRDQHGSNRAILSTEVARVLRIQELPTPYHTCSVMALLMPDINLRRKRKSFENFWLRAIGGENNDTTNSDRIQAQSAKSPLSNRRRPRPLKEVPVVENRIERATTTGTRMLPKYDATVIAKEQPPSLKQRHPVTVLVKTPPTSSSSLPRSSRAPPRSRPRYVQRVPGPTLGHVLNLIRRNEGDVSELDFSNLSSRNKRLEPYGGVLVARVLTTNSTVTRLVIRDHAIGDRGAMAIADMLRHNATLEFIDLYSNDISDDGAEALAKALYGHASLQHLALWSNAITNRGARAFAEALKCNSTLTYLGLVHNRITADGAQALLDALEVNTHLETLNLATNRVPHAITSQIRITLARNRVDAPRVQATMAEGAVRQWLDQLRIQDNNPVDHSEMSGFRSCSEVDESEASGFLSCSDADDEDSDSVWI